jgi:hypothetical protein
VDGLEKFITHYLADNVAVEQNLSAFIPSLLNMDTKILGQRPFTGNRVNAFHFPVSNPHMYGARRWSFMRNSLGIMPHVERLPVQSYQSVDGFRRLAQT